MNLNTQNWKEFRVGDLFDIYPTRFIDDLSANDCTGSGVPLVVNSAVNNGVAGLYDGQPTEVGNIITFSDTTDGNTFFYQPSPFIGFAHVQGMHPKTREWTKEEMLFFSTIMMYESKGKYSYGRKMRRDVISEIHVKLPATANGEPDWQYMNDYISSLHYKPLTTTNKIGNVLNLNTSEWKEFSILDLFDIKRGNITSLNDVEEGDVPIVSASGDNEGISFYGNVPALYRNKITISLNGVNTGFTAYHNYDFNINVDCGVLIEKFNMNNYVGLFIASIINRLKFKYSYGRKMSLERIAAEAIKLPIKHNEDNSHYIDDTHKYSADGYVPDWQFMEDYIKSLPYGDRI